MNIATYIDHTILKPITSIKEVEQLCQEALQHNFAAVCVPPFYVKKAKNILQNTTIKVATVIGFPFGYSATEAKLAEIKKAIEDGADELDMVHNLAAISNGDWDYLENEIVQCLQPVRLHNKSLKLIIESGILSDDDIVKCCKIYDKHKVDFVKTSTGYAEKGASIHAVEIMRNNISEDVQIKASGGIRDYNTAMEYIQAGASRIGTSSGVKIINH